MELSDIIIQRIKENGPISFRDFMEMALYYPSQGYYTSPGDKIGATGDFYTSSSITSLYGEMLARQIEEMWRYMGEQVFTIVEYGAGTGMLCRDILATLKNNKPFYDQLQYCIIEKSPAMRQKQHLCDSEKIRWCESINEMGGVTGCIISNELVDTFAVHKVLMAETLMEVYVDYNDGFTEILLPAPAALTDYFEEMGIRLPRGYYTEVNINALEWIASISRELRSGYVITVDYGHPSSELYNSLRSEGTICCYHKHEVNYDPYINIGNQDITTHTNFSALARWGKINGLKCTGFTNQAHFLLGLGIREHLTDQLLSGIADAYATYRKNTFVMHHLLNDMGSRFKVLIQHKEVPDLPLSGLKLATLDSIYALDIPLQHTSHT